MSKCATCGKSIIAGGIRDHGFRFCSKPCHQRKASYIAKMRAIPDAVVKIEVEKIRHMRCARCKKNSGVEMHKSAFVWSMIFMTRFGEHKHVCCKTCALKSQAMDTVRTALFGWWGIPFGLIMTPISIVSNVSQMIITARRTQPSSALSEFARERLARQAAEREAAPG
jgi:hypothetical protein